MSFSEAILHQLTSNKRQTTNNTRSSLVYKHTYLEPGGGGETTGSKAMNAGHKGPHDVKSWLTEVVNYGQLIKPNST